jgi:nucleotide-binding universal stress UspA family protein
VAVINLEPLPRLVVGVRDSAASRWALAWAVGAARQYQMPLTVVSAFGPVSTTARTYLPIDEQHAAAADFVEALIDEVCGAHPSDIAIDLCTVDESAGRALVEVAHASDLLVIGSGGSVFGRTRRYCARHTPCPLVIVPQPDAGELLGTPIRTSRSVMRPHHRV